MLLQLQKQYLMILLESYSQQSKADNMTSKMIVKTNSKRCNMPVLEQFVTSVHVHSEIRLRGDIQMNTTNKNNLLLLTEVTSSLSESLRGQGC